MRPTQGNFRVSIPSLPSFRPPHPHCEARPQPDDDVYNLLPTTNTASKEGDNATRKMNAAAGATILCVALCVIGLPCAGPFGMLGPFRLRRQAGAVGVRARSHCA